eukprot:Ihof_evm14s85 gene=Ihof_evmTU14s85
MRLFSKIKDRDKDKDKDKDRESKSPHISKDDKKDLLIKPTLSSSAVSSLTEQKMQTGQVPDTTMEQVVAFENGKLTVEVVEVRGLEGAKTPYIIASYEHTEQVMPPNRGSRVVFDVTNPDFELHIQMIEHDTTDHSMLGRVDMLPSWVPNQTFDQVYKLHAGTRSGIELRLAITFCKQTNKKLTIDDFELLKVIGKGSFGKVMQVRKKDTGRVYAMKILTKSHLVERDEVGHTKSERAILASNAHCPFLVGLKFSFQTPEKIYLVLDYINGGELFFHLQNEGVFSENRARFYAAQLVLGLEYLHSMDVIYRDLKPENILVDYTGYIALTDFGLCKEDVKHNETTNTFCGTPEYMAPEVLQQKGYGPAVDWWTIGVLLYEMMTGIPPYYDDNTNTMYQKILFAQLIFPEDMTIAARDCIGGLLNRNPHERLGAGPNGARNVKSHMFFAQINWGDLWQKRIPAPWRPTV